MRLRNYLVGLSAVGLMAALAAALLVSTTTETVDAAEYTVNIREFSFNPSSLTLQVGDVVRWVNTGTVAHTASSETGVWDSGTLSPGGVFSQQFLTPGTYPYFCRIHAGMLGTIVVQAPPATATPVPPAAPTQPPATQAPPPPAPTAAPEPTAVLEPAPPAPTPVTPAPRAPELWLSVLEATPAYSMTDDILWIASPGEWYRILDQDAGWALTVWEFDPPDLTVWIELDGRVEVAAF
jgi:plastocyanin